MAVDVISRSSAESDTPLRSLRADEQQRRPVPIKWWATAGVAFIALQIYIYTDWIASGNAKPTPSGPTPIPEWVKSSALVVQILGVSASLGVIYWFVLRPLFRDRRLSTDGLMVLAGITLYWQDPLMNYVQNTATINTAVWNLGSWTTSVPGWMSPHGNLFAEAPLFSGQLYIYFVFGGMVVANKLMRKVQARWPRVGPLGLFAICFVFLGLVDLILEVVFMRLGLYSYGGAIRSFSVFAGHYYQFPLAETLCWGVTWTVLACFRYYVNDKGQTVAERGIEKLRTTSRRRTFIRFLAFAGIYNAIMLFVFTVPIQWFSMKGDPWPKAVTSRSYLTDGLCGPGTSYACSSRKLPIPVQGSAHVAPDGTLIPAGH